MSGFWTPSPCHCQTHATYQYLCSDVLDGWPLRRTSPHKSLIVGNTASGWKPARNNASKYFIPEEQFRGDVYPTFVTGPSYVVSKAGAFTTVWIDGDVQAVVLSWADNRPLMLC